MPIMPSSKMSSALQADAMLLVVTILAAAGWIFSRESLAGFSPLTFIALRFTGAGIILALLCRRSLMGLRREQWLASVRVGLLFGAAMVFWVLGLKFTNHLGVGAFLCSLGLVMVPFFSLLFGERPNLHAYLAVPVALAGLACLSLDGEFHLGVAEGCFLAAALVFALMYVMNSQASAKIPTLPLSAIQLLVTGGITTVGAFGFETPSIDQTSSIWGWFFASLLLATCLRFVLQTHAMGMAAPSHSAIIMNLEPVWTALLAMVWLNETMSGLQFSGCLLIFAAMLVNRWPLLRQWLRNGLKG